MKTKCRKALAIWAVLSTVAAFAILRPMPAAVGYLIAVYASLFLGWRAGAERARDSSDAEPALDGEAA